MATLKVYDGTQWQVVAGQGSPGQGVPAGGAAGQVLTKASAANLDTTWATPSAVAETRVGFVMTTPNASGDIAVTFATPFAGTPVAMVATSALQSSPITLAVYGLSKTGATIRCWNISTAWAASVSLYYIAST